MSNILSERRDELFPEQTRLGVLIGEHVYDGNMFLKSKGKQLFMRCHENEVSTWFDHDGKTPLFVVKDNIGDRTYQVAHMVDFLKNMGVAAEVEALLENQYGGGE